jgi:hypothetical protein
MILKFVFATLVTGFESVMTAGCEELTIEVKDKRQLAPVKSGGPRRPRNLTDPLLLAAYCVWRIACPAYFFHIAGSASILMNRPPTTERA